MYRRRTTKRSRSRSYRRAPRRVPRLPRAVRGYVRRSGMYTGRFQGTGGVELKVFDNLAYMGTNAVGGGANGYTPVAAGQCLPLLYDTRTTSGIRQDTGVTGRIGSKIVIRSIFLQGLIQYALQAESAYSGLLSDSVRWWIVLDKQSNGATPAFTDVFAVNDPITGIVSSSGVMNAMRNISNNTRFRILKEGAIQMPTTSLSQSKDSTAYQAAAPNRFFKCYMKCQIPIEYGNLANPSLGVVADIKENNLLLLWQSFRSETKAFFTTRMRFADS